MAQLDPLIQALVKHRAEALVLEGGQQACLLMGGARQPVVQTPLSPEQVALLLGEITPEPQRPALRSGGAISFNYRLNGTSVVVRTGGGQPTIIQIGDGPAPAGAPGATPASPAGAATAQVASTPAATPSDGTAPASPSLNGGENLNMDQLFRAMVEQGASDLHVSSGSQPMLRVDGEMASMAGLSALDAEAVEKLLEPIIPERNGAEFAEDNDTDFAYEIPGLCRFRCNIFRDRKGPGGVFRVIPSKILTVDDLNLSQELRNLCYLSKGLVLVTGPTGSGKSTTLTALIDLMNKVRNDHIITIEDPIEFVHENKKCLINQREVNIHTTGFKRALRAALREDPDIVLVGEMRDLETVAIALETAETGHLVFGTLHTSSAISTIDRLIDQFPADQQGQVRVMLGESLKAVIAQVLCRKKGGGRVAALEVLMVTPAVANLIREGKTFQIQSIMQTGKKLGMVTLNDSLLALAKSGVVEPREAYVKAIDKSNLLGAFKSNDINVDFLETTQS